MRNYLKDISDAAEGLKEEISEQQSPPQNISEEQLQARKMTPDVARLEGVPWSEWCFPLKSFGLDSWDLRKAAEAWSNHMKQLYPEVRQGRQRIILEMVDLGVNCMPVENGKALAGRRVRTRAIVCKE